MKFIIGIGNPGKEYKHSRHNVGFEVLDRIKQKRDVLLIKPATFVNRTGDAVSVILEKHRPDSQALLIVCDDVNLSFGKLRLRRSGSAGGHHGLESVIAALGCEDFPRLRLGVKNETMPKDLTAFVLGRFSSVEKKALPKILEKAALVCETWAKEGFSAAERRLSQLQSVNEG